LGEEKGETDVPLFTRARRRGAPFVLGRDIDSESFESCSPPCLSASATAPSRRYFAVNMVASFAGGLIGYASRSLI
jgi:hypothetical protein